MSFISDFYVKNLKAIKVSIDNVSLRTETGAQLPNKAFLTKTSVTLRTFSGFRDGSSFVFLVSRGIYTFKKYKIPKSVEVGELVRVCSTLI